MARMIQAAKIAEVFTEFDVADGTAQGFGVVGDVVMNPAGERLNSATWASGDTKLEGGTDIFSSSTQYASSGEYFVDVYQEDPSTVTDAEPQFAISYGHYWGSGSTTLEGQSEGKTFTAAMYGQMAALVEDKGESTNDTIFTINDANSTSSIFIQVYRNRMKERLDPGNWELKIQGDAGKPLVLIDEMVASASNDSGDGPFSVVSGTLATGTDAVTTQYGKFYPNYGLIVLDSELVSASAPISISQDNFSYDGVGNSSAVTAKTNQNTQVLFNAVSASGASFQARSTEQIHSRTYFCRIPNYKYNFSSNPTFANQDNGVFTHQTMVGNPKVYITTVGLYNDNNDLIAVARLSKPLLKSFEREALIRVRLEY